VISSEFEPELENEMQTEDKFMNKLNAVVNRYTIQNNIFSDIKFVPHHEHLVYTAGATFIALWV